MIPQLVIDKVVLTSTERVPVLCPTYEFSKKIKKVTKIVNPVPATSHEVKIVAIAYLDPVIKYLTLCTLRVFAIRERFNF